MKLTNLIEKKYLFYKGIASTSALLFAFIYSSSLGVINRSIVTYIFVLSTLIWIVVTSGSTLTLRKIQPNLDSPEMKSFIGLTSLQSFVALVMFITGIEIYSRVIIKIPENLYYLTIIYFLAAGLALLLIEYLISQLKYVLASRMELVAVLLQFIVFELLKYSSLFSISVSLLLGFIISYLIISILIIQMSELHKFGNLSFSSPSYFWNLSKGSHTLGVSIAVLDRLDKIFIAYFFPIGALAPYSILTSLISVLRFIPEYLSRLLISYKKIYFLKFRFSKTIAIATTILILTLISISSRGLIFALLGEDWVMPLAVCFAVSIQEAMRALFQFQLNRLALLDKIHLKTFVPIFSLIVLIPFLYILSLNLGLVGVPVAYIFLYGIISYLIFKEGQKSLSL